MAARTAAVDRCRAGSPSASPSSVPSGPTTEAQADSSNTGSNRYRGWQTGNRGRSSGRAIPPRHGRHGCRTAPRAGSARRIIRLLLCFFALDARYAPDWSRMAVQPSRRLLRSRVHCIRDRVDGASEHPIKMSRLGHHLRSGCAAFSISRPGADPDTTSVLTPAPARSQIPNCGRMLCTRRLGSVFSAFVHVNVPCPGRAGAIAVRLGLSGFARDAFL
jgi:hypothetical protein